ncbi:MAG: D-alanyl-D-alanine carboxypeptidase [Pseudomonadota bacterium]|nr:D-alanyl-D-alanine carboxypeptidase [Pseudomonadota bacterium]MDE3037914.1 D-alanyl-D-alanine carboxypeptidase [Pseudomonadota bacterium]
MPLSPAYAIDTVARQAFLVDMNTGAVLLNKNGDEEMHPSSMSKLMTIYILFQRLKAGRVKLDDQFTVSEKAWRTQGSKTFVGLGDSISVDDLIHGIIVQSGNDACIVVAEGLDGTEDAFVAEMNSTAKALGLAHSHFANATGLPDPTHLMTARDLATLAERIITDFPEYYHYFDVRSFTYNHITQGNRNRLLGDDIGVDGLKTGHTEEGGYGITLSARQKARRLLLVLNGMDTDNERVEEGSKLLRWGFRAFEDKTILRKGQKLADAEVWFGNKALLPLVAGNDVTLTLPAGDANIAMTLKYVGPIPAPVAKGAHVADLIVKAGDLAPQSIPLVAGEDVGRISGFGRLWAVVSHYAHR